MARQGGGAKRKGQWGRGGARNARNVVGEWQALKRGCNSIATLATHDTFVSGRALPNANTAQYITPTHILYIRRSTHI